jgi:hypothetical protein
MYAYVFSTLRARAAFALHIFLAVLDICTIICMYKYTYVCVHVCMYLESAGCICYAYFLGGFGYMDHHLFVGSAHIYRTDIHGEYPRDSAVKLSLRVCMCVCVCVCVCEHTVVSACVCVYVCMHVYKYIFEHTLRRRE